MRKLAIALSMMLVVMFSTSSCHCVKDMLGFKNDVTLTLDASKDKLEVIQADVTYSVGILHENNESMAESGETLTKNQAIVIDSAEAVKTVVIETPLDGYTDVITAGIISNTDKIIALTATNQKIVKGMQSLTEHNELLFKQLQKSNKDMSNVYKMLDKASKSYATLADDYSKLEDVNEQMFKERLYLILSISVIALGICVAMMTNPSTTKWGKMGGVAAFTICAVCLSLIYYGKVGAAIVGVVLVIVGGYIIYHAITTNRHVKAIKEAGESIGIAKAEMHDDEELRIFGKDQVLTGIATTNHSKHTSKLLQPHIDKVKPTSENKL
jgi:hypothetical protein